MLGWLWHWLRGHDWQLIRDRGGWQYFECSQCHQRDVAVSPCGTLRERPINWYWVHGGSGEP